MEVSPRDVDVGVLWTKPVKEDGESRLYKPTRLSPITQVPKHLAQISILESQVWMVGVEGPLVDLDGALEQVSGGGEVSLVLHHHREVGVARREGGVVSVEGLLLDLDGALEQPTGGGEIALVLHHGGEVRVARCEVGVVGVEGLLVDLNGALEQPTGSGEVTLILDEGEVDMKPLDVVVQRGTNHAWSNRGDKIAVLAGILIDAEPV